MARELPRISVRNNGVCPAAVEKRFEAVSIDDVDFFAVCLMTGDGLFVVSIVSMAPPVALPTYKEVREPTPWLSGYCSGVCPSAQQGEKLQLG